MEFLAIKPCKYDAYEAVPKGRVTLDLERSETILSERGYEILSNPKVMLVVKKDVEVTIYPAGRLLMHPIKDKVDAERVARQVYRDLGK